MLNSPTIPHHFLQPHLPPSLPLFRGFARLFFHGNYFTSSTATPYRIYSCHGNIWARERENREREGDREGEGVEKKRKREWEIKKKRKSIESWQGNNWFHYIQPADSLYHRWQGDGGPAKEADVCVWVVINYCRGQGCAGHTPWLNETKLISLWHLPASSSGIWRCRDKSYNPN